MKHQGRAWDEHASELLALWLKNLRGEGATYRWSKNDVEWYSAEAEKIPQKLHDVFKKALDLLIRIERMEWIINLDDALRRRTEELKKFWHEGVPVCPVNQDDGCESCLRFRQLDAMCAERDSEACERNKAQRDKLLFCMHQGLRPEYVRVEKIAQMEGVLRCQQQLPWIAVASQRQKEDMMMVAGKFFQSPADLLLVEQRIIMLLSSSAIRLRERNTGRDTCYYVLMRELKYGPRDWSDDAPHDDAADDATDALHGMQWDDVADALHGMQWDDTAGDAE